MNNCKKMDKKCEYADRLGMCENITATCSRSRTMRLIDADAFAEEMKKRQDACKEWTQRTIDTVDEENYLRSCGAYVVFVEAKLLLEKQPTIDAVQVVRCEECVHHDTGIDEEGKPFMKCLNGRSYGGTTADWFCADGERRDPCSSQDS